MCEERGENKKKIFFSLVFFSFLRDYDLRDGGG